MHGAIFPMQNQNSDPHTGNYSIIQQADTLMHAHTQPYAGWFSIQFLVHQYMILNTANIVICQTLGEMSTPSRAHYIGLRRHGCV
jgi:hypothetical protein